MADGTGVRRGNRVNSIPSGRQLRRTPPMGHVKEQPHLCDDEQFDTPFPRRALMLHRMKPKHTEIYPIDQNMGFPRVLCSMPSAVTDTKDQEPKSLVATTKVEDVQRDKRRTTTITREENLANGQKEEAARAKQILEKKREVLVAKLSSVKPELADAEETNKSQKKVRMPKMAVILQSPDQADSPATPSQLQKKKGAIESNKMAEPSQVSTNPREPAKTSLRTRQPKGKTGNALDGSTAPLEAAKRPTKHTSGKSAKETKRTPLKGRQAPTSSSNPVAATKRRKPPAQSSKATALRESTPSVVNGAAAGCASRQPARTYDRRKATAAAHENAGKPAPTIGLRRSKRIANMKP
ncbi:proteoglycan 4-like [Lampris incognitus]|uniref:proteoglycan 4-like n=1 Tax=Lampris incognitus TaxID=2546036 RepID=UPI0024B4E9CA|nr:proteoglycan 4-like [Lampris incognitus]XP_056157481.1 proteoglycan 4-like [Lampris incognitus]XP_056157482.1 proteoglycan 4-like [Lampris incognitus]XP_056157483.1 proteoglycan 4-like [Lampris incognitus]XP_056157484.1 proteoglycan 4-like [Lampris incognitus]